MTDNDFKREWGLEVTWADEENYCSKFLVFEKEKNKTPFHFHKETNKTWFVNAGKFMVRWIDTADGKIYEQELKEGSVFQVEKFKPVSLECLTANSSIVEASSFNTAKDYNIVLPTSAMV